MTIPVTPGTVAAGEAIWRAIRPVKRIKAALLRRKQRKARERGEVIDVPKLQQEVDMNWDQIEGTIRHVLTFGGGFVVAKGWLSAEELTAVVGGLLAVAGVAHSIYQKRKAKAAA